MSDGIEPFSSLPFDRFPCCNLHAFHLPQTEPDSAFSSRCLLKCAVPVAMVHIDGSHLHAMLACIANKLRRRIETHWLRIQKSRAECIRIVILEPCRNI